MAASFNTITIEDATDCLIDYRGKTPPKTASGIRLITAKVVKGGQILDEPAEFIAENYYDEWMRRGLPRKLDVLLTTEAPLGELAVLRGNDKIALAQRIILLRAKTGRVDPLFLFYALQSDFGQGELRARSSGTTVLGIKQSELRKVRIPIFPLPKQKRVADILSAYDDLIGLRQRHMRILEMMVRSLYREWFVNFRFPGHEESRMARSALGKIPEGWCVRPLSQLCSRMESGGTPRRNVAEYWADGDIQWFTTGELWDNFLFESKEQITELGQRNSTARLFDAGTIFMAIYGSPTVGRLGVATKRSSCNQAALGLVANPQIISQTFLYFVLLSLRTHFNGIAQGAAQQNISKEKVANSVAVVPLHSLIEAFDRVAEPIFRQLETLQQQIRILRDTRDLLLPLLLCGQIDLQVS